MAQSKVITETKAIQNLFERVHVLQAVYKYDCSLDGKEPLYTRIPLQNIVVAPDGDDRDGHSLIQVAFESLDAETPYVNENDFDLWTSYMDVQEQHGDAVTAPVGIDDEYGQPISYTFKGSITTIAKVEVENFIIAGVPFSKFYIRDYYGNYIVILASTKVKKPIFTSFVKAAEQDTEVTLTKASLAKIFDLLEENLFGFPYKVEVTNSNVKASYNGFLTVSKEAIQSDYAEIKLDNIDKADASIIAWGDNSLCLVWNKQTRNQISVELYFRQEYYNSKLMEELT